MSIYDKDRWSAKDLAEYRRMQEEQDEERWLDSFPTDDARQAALDDRTDKRMRRAGIPERYLRSTPVPFGGGWQYICGDVGTGKTFRACGIARWHLQYRKGGVLFTSSVAMLNDVFNTRNLAPYTLHELLIIDDLGKETPTPWALSQLFEIVNARYGGMRPTVITSNLEPRDLAIKLAQNGGKETADAIVSRIVEASMFVRLGGGDRRLDA